MPRKNRTGLTPAVIESLRSQGLTQAEIASRYDVTPSYVSWVKKQYGGVTQTPREVAKGMFPWSVPQRFHRAYPNIRLRDHLEYQLTSGKGMTQSKLTLLTGFYRRLINENVVVEFDPNIPPTEGVYTGGWAFRPRIETDGDLIIRVNEYAKELDEEAKIVWRLPPRLPNE